MLSVACKPRTCTYSGDLTPAALGARPRRRCRVCRIQCPQCRRVRCFDVPFRASTRASSSLLILSMPNHAHPFTISLIMLTKLPGKYEPMPAWSANSIPCTYRTIPSTSSPSEGSFAPTTVLGACIFTMSSTMYLSTRVHARDTINTVHHMLNIDGAKGAILAQTLSDLKIFRAYAVTRPEEDGVDRVTRLREVGRARVRRDTLSLPHSLRSAYHEHRVDGRPSTRDPALPFRRSHSRRSGSAR